MYLKYIMLLVITVILIAVMICIKYNLTYKVSIDGQVIGYIGDTNLLEEKVRENIINSQNLNVDNIDLQVEPEYELMLVSRSEDTNESEMIETIKESAIVTYKYYNITVAEEIIQTVNTMEEAEELINIINSDGTEIESLSVIESFTQNSEEINVSDFETAKLEIKGKAITIAEQKEAERIAQEEYDALPEINGIKIAATPVQGIITSRYGEISSLRTSAHTGLDIAATQGTPISAVSSGTIICAEYNSSYGYYIKIDHGSGFESLYAHCSQLYVSEGEYVNAGDVIAALGSTGNSTGPHLHLELWMNGKTVNPQAYIYN